MDPTPSILVVDDEADHCHNLADILVEFDFDVDIAGNGAEAMHLIEEKSYNIALLDLAMPGLDGLALSRKIAGIRPGLRPCFITAHTCGKLADEVRASRVGPLLAKPLDVPRLLYWIDGTVGRRKCLRDQPGRRPSSAAN